MTTQHEIEIVTGNRFAFGKNWERFLVELDDNSIELARQSLCDMLKIQDLQRKGFLDIGSGSGLFSLVARRLGASVHSFDYDPHSVACTNELKKRYFPEDTNWKVEQASVLDLKYLADLGKFDIVYSWGVLHHTGDMWQALQNVSDLVREDGRLFIAIYNDQGRSSRWWLVVKKVYDRLPSIFRYPLLLLMLLRLWGPTCIRELFAGRPFHTWRSYARVGQRGMSPWRDVIDWVGGLPFEVAKPEQIFRFYNDRGFRLEELKTCAGGLGCNEFVLRKC